MTRSGEQVVSTTSDVTGTATENARGGTMRVEDPIEEAVAETLLQMAGECIRRVGEESTTGNQQIGRMLQPVALEIELVAEKIGYTNPWGMVLERRWDPESTLRRVSHLLS
jgi:hypothetical protein